MIVVSAQMADNELADGLLARRLGIGMARDPGIDRSDLRGTKGDGQRRLGFRVRHIHRLMRGGAPVKPISPSVRRQRAAKPEA